MSTALAPVDVVRAFFSDVGTDGPVAAYERWLAPDVLWTNCGRPDCHSVDEVIALEREAQSGLGYQTWTAELRSIAADGDVVLTDRIDRLLTPDGDVLVEIEVMGSLLVADGRIVEWREYFDGPKIRESLGITT